MTPAQVAIRVAAEADHRLRLTKVPLREKMKAS